MIVVALASIPGRMNHKGHKDPKDTKAEDESGEIRPVAP